MRILGFTDGAARGNPGPGGIGVVLKDESGTILLKEKKFLGNVTNNIAEYTALLECLNHVSALIRKTGIPCTTLVLHSDSELMVRQMKGEYKVKDVVLKKLFSQARKALSSSEFEFLIKHVPREKNREADALANESIDEHPHS
jgi:ribonuclease HI